GSSRICCERAVARFVESRGNHQRLDHRRTVPSDETLELSRLLRSPPSPAARCCLVSRLPVHPRLSLRALRARTDPPMNFNPQSGYGSADRYVFLDYCGSARWLLRPSIGIVY